MEDHTAIVSLKNVTKKFGDKTAVNNLSLQIGQGEVFGFLGPNGAGKSTTIRMILDILRPTSGEIRLFGQSNRLVAATHARIGYLAGDMAFDTDLSGRRYLDYIASARGVDCGARIRQLASRLDVNLKTKLGDYSRGNRQKVGLIAALMHQPELLVFDEPTSGFDPLVQEIFAELVREFQAGGGTVLMSSHILSEVRELCDRIGFIKEGVFGGDKTIAELTASASKQVTIRADAEVLKTAGHFKGLEIKKSSAGTASFVYSGELARLLEFLGKQKLQDLTIEEPDLEEVFLGYYKSAGGKKHV